MLSHATEGDCTEAIRKLCIFLGCFSSIFWIWAIVNTATKDYIDGGIVSFATVMVSSLYGFFLIKNRMKQNHSKIGYEFFLPLASFFLVAANYAVGAHLTKHEWNELYCVIFSGMWIGISIVYACLVWRLRQIERERPLTPENSVVEVDEQAELEEKPDLQIT